MQDYENTAVDENVQADQTNNSNNKKGGKVKNDKAPAEVETIDTAEADTKGINKAEAEDKAPKSTSKQAFMYLGPNIPGGRLFSGSVIRGGSPADIAHLQDVLEKLPEVKGLFVEVVKVPKFKAEVVTQGTEAHRLYTVAVSQLKKGVLKDGI